MANFGKTAAAIARKKRERENLVVLVDNLDFFLPAMQDHCTG